MLTAEVIRNVIQKAEKQIEELQQLIDSLNAVEMEPGRVAKSERYWYISDVGMIRFTTDERSDSDDYRYECGNYYLTEEDAERAEKQIRLYRLLDRFSRQNGWNDEDWKNDEWKHYIFFDYSTNILRVGVVSSSRDTNQVYFVSEDIAQKAIEEYHDLIVEVMQI